MTENIISSKAKSVTVSYVIATFFIGIAVAAALGNYFNKRDMEACLALLEKQHGNNSADSVGYDSQ